MWDCPTCYDLLGVTIVPRAPGIHTMVWGGGVLTREVVLTPGLPVLVRCPACGSPSDTAQPTRTL